MINGHGNNLYDYKGEIKADFSSNIAFNNNSTEIIDYLGTQLACITNYPDPEARILSAKLAQHHGVDQSQILVTNGSAEAFYLIAHLFQGVKTAICTPSFAEYEDACTLFRHSLLFCPIEDFQTTDFEMVDTVWLGTPNNPDGTLTDVAVIVRKCRQNPSRFFVVDRAYGNLTTDYSQTMDVDEPNLITTHSLTKAFAVPGIRLGYIIASTQIIEKLAAMRAPWGVNALSLVAGEYIVDNYEKLLPSMAALSRESLFLQESLGQIVDVKPSTCNFFMSRLKHRTAAELKDRLMDEHKILIRDCSNFRGLDGSYFRISAQTNIKNRALVNALKQIL